MEGTSPVRVEVDGSFDAASSFPAPDAPESPDSKGPLATLVAGGVLVVAFVAALLVLRPSAGETAAGTERQATTTTTSTTVAVTTTAPAAAPMVREGDGATGNTRADIFEVVRDDIGFFGLGFGNGPGDFELFRSLQGVSWTPVEVEFTDSASPGPNTWITFSNLVVTEDGFAALRTEEQFAATASFDRATTVERMVSTDGVIWDLDEGAEPIDIRFRDSWSTFQTADTFGVNSGVASAPFGQLLEGLLTDDPGIDPANVCWMDLVGLNQIRTFPCEDGTDSGVIPDLAIGTDITESDFIEPARFDDLVMCMGVLFDFAFATGDFSSFVQHSSGELSTYSTSVASALHTPLTDGSVVALSFGNLFLEETVACDSFNGGLPEIGPPAIEYLELDGGVRQIPLPQEVGDSLEQIWTSAPSFQESDEGLRVLLANAAWVLDLDSGEWSKTSDLQVDSGQFFEHRFTGDGRVVGIGDDAMSITHLDTGVTNTYEFDGQLDRYGRIVYIDAEVVVIDVEGEIVTIELPPQ